MGGTLEGLKCYDPASEKVIELERNGKASYSFDSLRINAMLEDVDGHLWIGVREGGLNKYNPTIGINQLFTHDPTDEKSLAHNDVSSLMRDKYGTMWIGMLGGGMDKYIAGHHFQHFRHYKDDPSNLSSDRVSFLMEGEGNNIWIGHRGPQLDIFNSNTESFEHYAHNPDDPSSIGTGSVWWMVWDESGIVWIAQNELLNKLDLLKGYFVNHQHQIGNKQSLSHNTIPSVEETTDGGIWVGTWGGGLNRFDPATGLFEQFPFGAAAPETLLENKIRDLYASRNGGLWVRHMSGKATYFDGEKFKLYRDNPDDLDRSGSSPVGFVMEDDKGNMWWGNIYGVTRVHLVSGEYKSFKTDEDFPKGDLLGILKGRDGEIWIYGFGGLHRYNPKKDVFHEEKLMNNKPSLVSALYEDDDGIMWLGVEKGLLRFDVGNKDHYLYSQKEGLTNTSIACILEDDRGRLWISTDGGVFRFQKDKEEFTHFNSGDGLSNDAYLIGSCCKSKSSGRMYFGGAHGFTEFHPDNIQANIFMPLSN